MRKSDTFAVMPTTSCHYCLGGYRLLSRYCLDFFLKNLDYCLDIRLVLRPCGKIKTNSNKPSKIKFNLFKAHIHALLQTTCEAGLLSPSPRHLLPSTLENIEGVHCTLGIHLRCPGAQVNTLTLLRLAYSLL
jgi:hypothetical protein